MVPPASIRVSRVPMYSGYCCGSSGFVYGAFTLFGRLSQNLSTTVPPSHDAVHNPKTNLGLASFPFARRYSGNRSFFLFLPLLRCFSSRRFPSITYWFTYGWLSFPQPGFPIRTSADRYLFAIPRGFSQLITSFFGFRCQGIPLVLLLAWPS